MALSGSGISTTVLVVCSSTNHETPKFGRTPKVCDLLGRGQFDTGGRLQ